jgi:hypothetical protein
MDNLDAEEVKGRRAYQTKASTETVRRGNLSPDESDSDSLGSTNQGKTSEIEMDENRDGQKESIQLDESNKSISFGEKESMLGEGNKSIGEKESMPFDESNKSADFGFVDTSRDLSASIISRLSFGDDPLTKLNDLEPSTKRKKKKSISWKEREGSDEEPTEDKEESLRPNRRLLSLDKSRKSVREQMNSMHSMMSTMALGAVTPRDADDFNDEEELEHNKKWKVYAARIDDVARFFIPLAFFIGFAVILADVL